ncbi:AraC family transcriptional regulator [Myroides sp. WP-1]|uniref:helix-turn-helix transcriptional regulator n=1 Tax=Myroides sp. WP-1 TaxID=2759944 RepID=UPI002102DCF8|nr:AraC family transcriptional regulator [Myroides sp. WP-1]
MAMTLRLYDSKHKQTLVEKEYPSTYFDLGKDGIKEHTTYLNSFLGRGFYKEIYFDGIHIGFGDMQLAHKLLLGFDSNFETIEMHFTLQGKSTAYTSQFDRNISFNAHAHNLLYTNGLGGKMEWEHACFQQVEINLRPEYFAKFTPTDHPLFDQFRNAIAKGKSSLLHPEHYQINHQMYQIIEQIIHCDKKGIFKRLFLEAKVIELLLLQFEQFCDKLPYQGSLKQHDIDKIHAVRQYILQHLDSHYSLLDLAHIVGTNEFILKKGFKELFGTTVFSFWAHAKMEHAVHLLREGVLNISEISDQIGYKNQRHFATAFKKKYGVSPSQYLQNI